MGFGLTINWKATSNIKFYPIHTIQPHLKTSSVDGKTQWGTYLDMALRKEELMLLVMVAVALTAALQDGIWS